MRARAHESTVPHRLPRFPLPQHAQPHGPPPPRGFALPALQPEARGLEGHFDFSNVTVEGEVRSHAHCIYMHALYGVLNCIR